MLVGDNISERNGFDFAILVVGIQQETGLERAELLQNFAYILAAFIDLNSFLVNSRASQTIATSSDDE
ncbi:hypothetical protein CIB48_g2361 [Xylaria polymorpha]|nr:hypothetical protein CIB48_g2361 [Xylaria polymorpha]